MKQSDAAIGYMENALTLPFVLTICVASGEFGSFENHDSTGLFVRATSSLQRAMGSEARAITPWVALQGQSRVTIALIVATCIFAGSMSVIYINLYRLLSATSVTVLGNVNKVVCVVVAAKVFKKFLFPAQIVALAVVMGAGVWFGTERKRTLEARKRGSLPADSKFEVQEVRRKHF